MPTNYPHFRFAQRSIPSTDPEARCPISLAAHAQPGSVNIYLPRTFNGQLTLIALSGSCALSRGVSAALTVTSADRRCKSALVGELRPASPSTQVGGPTNHKRDEVVLESRGGHVRVAYVDEELPVAGGIQERLGQIFSGITSIPH